MRLQVGWLWLIRSGMILAVLMLSLLALPASANEQCQDLELTGFRSAQGYGANRFWVTVFNHENYGEPAPIGAAVAVFFEAQDSQRPITKAHIWPPKPQTSGSYLIYVPGAADHRLTAAIICYR